MLKHENQMYENIRKLFKDDLELLNDDIPSNGIWSVCKIPDTEYQGAVRVISAELGAEQYALWVDVFETIYDPIFSNSLYKGNLKQIRNWLQEESHIQEVSECMQHLMVLAKDD